MSSYLFVAVTWLVAIVAIGMAAIPRKAKWKAWPRYAFLALSLFSGCATANFLTRLEGPGAFMGLLSATSVLALLISGGWFIEEAAAVFIHEPTTIRHDEKLDLSLFTQDHPAVKTKKHARSMSMTQRMNRYGTLDRIAKMRIRTRWLLDTQR